MKSRKGASNSDGITSIYCEEQAPGVQSIPTPTLGDVLNAFNATPIDMVSGAGHDSVNVAAVAPTAMIFVPCAGGLSHNEAESASAADLETGANVLMHAMLAVANENT